jgi:hypothetical protein
VKQLVLGIVTLVAACQDATMTTSTSEQAIGSVCNVQGPPAQPWKGGYLPQTPPTTTIVLLDYGNQWRAYAADPANFKIHWIYTVTPAAVPKFLAATVSTNRGQMTIRNPPPPRCPPGPCGDDWFAFAAAQRLEIALGEAEADVDACY